jgi:hypothetical protein
MSELKQKPLPQDDWVAEFCDSVVYVDEHKATMRRTQYDKLVAKLQLQEATIADLAATTAPVDAGEEDPDESLIKPVSDEEANAAYQRMIEEHGKPSALFVMASHLKGCESCRRTFETYFGGELDINTGKDQPWPLRSCIDKLIEAADILLVQMDYDAHGWELIEYAKNLAAEYLDANAGEPLTQAPDTAAEPPAQAEAPEQAVDLLPCLKCGGKTDHDHNSYWCWSCKRLWPLPVLEETEDSDGNPIAVPVENIGTITEGKMVKGGTNPPNTSDARPAAPKGSGGNPFHRMAFMIDGIGCLCWNKGDGECIPKGFRPATFSEAKSHVERTVAENASLKQQVAELSEWKSSLKAVYAAFHDMKPEDVSELRESIVDLLGMKVALIKHLRIENTRLKAELAGTETTAELAERAGLGTAAEMEGND